MSGVNPLSFAQYPHSVVHEERFGIGKPTVGILRRNTDCICARHTGLRRRLGHSTKLTIEELGDRRIGHRRHRKLTLPGGEDDWVLQARIRRSENMAVEVDGRSAGLGPLQVTMSCALGMCYLGVDCYNVLLACLLSA